MKMYWFSPFALPVIWHLMKKSCSKVADPLRATNTTLKMKLGLWSMPVCTRSRFGLGFEIIPFSLKWSYSGVVLNFRISWSEHEHILIFSYVVAIHKFIESFISQTKRISSVRPRGNRTSGLRADGWRMCLRKVFQMVLGSCIRDSLSFEVSGLLWCSTWSLCFYIRIIIIVQQRKLGVFHLLLLSSVTCLFPCGWYVLKCGA